MRSYLEYDHLVLEHPKNSGNVGYFNLINYYPYFKVLLKNHGPSEDSRLFQNIFYFEGTLAGLCCWYRTPRVISLFPTCNHGGGTALFPRSLEAPREE